MYDKLHPVFGEPDEIARVKRILRGLRGERVVLVFKGAYQDEDGETTPMRLRRTFNYRNYKDVFGPGSAYASIIHWMRDNDSDKTLITYDLTIGIADDEDEDEDE